MGIVVLHLTQILINPFYMGQVILDFIKENYFVIVYGITWFISAFTYRKFYDTVLKYFPIIIAYTFFSELLGWLIANNENFQLVFGYKQANNRNIIYNIYHFCFFLFFFYVYWKSISNKNHKKIIKYAALLFIVINVLTSFIQNPLVQTLVYAYIYGVILLIYCTIVYFRKVLAEYDIDLLKYSLLFWVSMGLLIFYTTYLPLKIMKEFYVGLYLPFRQFHYIMIVLMYIIFSIGFIISKRRAFR